MASVLLVGLDDSDRQKARSDLEDAGHVVTEATTRQLLQVADKGTVDVVVIDISPLKHGTHLVGIMELRRRHPALPILAVCGGRDARALLNIATQAGADATLQKPFAREALVRAVAQCLAARKGP